SSSIIIGVSTISSNSQVEISGPKSTWKPLYIIIVSSSASTVSPLLQSKYVPSTLIVVSGCSNTKCFVSLPCAFPFTSCTKTPSTNHFIVLLISPDGVKRQASFCASHCPVFLPGGA